MLSDKIKENINNLIYSKFNNLIETNKLDYIKNDIFESLRINHNVDLYDYDDVYDYLQLQLNYNTDNFTKIETIEELQDILKIKFNKFIDKNFIKNIFAEIKRVKYS